MPVLMNRRSVNISMKRKDLRSIAAPISEHPQQMEQGELVNLQNTTALCLYVTRSANLSHYGAQLNTLGWYKTRYLSHLRIIINYLHDKRVWFLL